MLLRNLQTFWYAIVFAAALFWVLAAMLEGCDARREQEKRAAPKGGAR